MAFRGWKVEALEFFEGLEVENSKAYWARNKATYEQLVRAPMEELLAELAPDWGDGRSSARIGTFGSARRSPPTRPTWARGSARPATCS